MEFRKIIAFGKSSFVISLPKAWMETNKLAKGDVVFLEQDSDKLMLVPKEKESEQEVQRTVINVQNKDLNRIKREIAAAFINFNDYIVIEGKDLPNVSEDLINFIHKLVALEIVDQASDKIVAKDFLKVGDVAVKEYLRKSDIIIRSMMSDLKDKSFRLYSDVALRQKNVDRIYLVIFKVIKAIHKDPSLVKKGELSLVELMKYQRYNYCLYRIAKFMKHIAKNMKLLKEGERQKVRDLISELYSHFSEVMKSTYVSNLEKAYSLSGKKADVRDSLDAVILKGSNKLVLITYLITMIYLDIHELNHMNYD